MSITIRGRRKVLMDRSIGEGFVSGKIGSKTYVTAIYNTDLTTCAMDDGRWLMIDGLG
jgi:hypothetical protein